MKTIINALTLALIEGQVLDHLSARDFATQFVEENAELFSAPPPPLGRIERVRPADLREPGQPLDEGEAGGTGFRHVPVVGPDGLTDKQRAAVQSGAGLCANCQQPKNAHLPGCAVASGENPRAVTRTPLPPAV